MGLGNIRNNPCPCGKPIKYKKCCLQKDIEVIRAMKFVDPKTGKIVCVYCKKEFKEGDTIDWVTFPRGGSFPVCIKCKAEDAKARKEYLNMTNKKRSDTI